MKSQQGYPSGLQACEKESQAAVSVAVSDSRQGSGRAAQVHHRSKLVEQIDAAYGCITQREIYILFNKAEIGKRIHTFKKLQSSISGKKLQ
jgi:hypothetical protein